MEEKLSYIEDEFSFVDKEEYIICAAIHFDDGNEYCHQAKNVKTGFVITGRRHYNCFCLFSALRSLRGTTERDIKHYDIPFTEGFLTSRDRFVNRYEAGQIAFKAGQIESMVSVLFSEHLY